MTCEEIHVISRQIGKYTVIRQLSSWNIFTVALINTIFILIN